MVWWIFRRLAVCLVLVGLQVGPEDWPHTGPVAQDKGLAVAPRDLGTRESQRDVRVQVVATAHRETGKPDFLAPAREAEPMVGKN